MTGLLEEYNAEHPDTPIDMEAVSGVAKRRLRERIPNITHQIPHWWEKH